MQKLNETLLKFWQQIKGFAAKHGKALLEKVPAVTERVRQYSATAVKFLKHHRVATTAVCCLTVLTMLMSVITVTIHRVEVYENGALVYTYHTAAPDEESILEKSGLTLGQGDEYQVSESKGIVTANITRAFPVSIQADGQTILVMMTEGTVAKALTMAGLACGQKDRLNYETTAEVFSGMSIQLDRVSGKQIVETESISFTTKEIKTSDLYVGETKVQQKGEKGEKTYTYQVTYVNGEESERELISEQITKDPVEKIVLVGTKAKQSFLKNSTAPAGYKTVLYMECTAYSGGGTTASGLPAQWGVVAVDPNVIPLGTKVYVETPDGKYIYGTAVAADTGGAIKGNIIDICVNTRKEAYSFGRRMVNVYIY